MSIHHLSAIVFVVWIYITDSWNINMCEEYSLIVEIHDILIHFVDWSTSTEFADVSSLLAGCHCRHLHNILQIHGMNVQFLSSFLIPCLKTLQAHPVLVGHQEFYLGAQIKTISFFFFCALTFHDYDVSPYTFALAFDTLILIIYHVLYSGALWFPLKHLQ